jgi:hypothetical protein
MPYRIWRRERTKGVIREEGVMHGTEDPAFREFGDALIGDWTTSSEHRLLPGTVIEGRASFEWFDGKRFLVWREQVSHPDFPGSSLSLIGGVGRPKLYYFDSRGVVREFEMTEVAGSWTFTRTTSDDASDDFDQRLTWTHGGDGTIRGLAEMREDGGPWVDDLWTRYRRT